jgi:hypothetical protein
MVTMVSSGYERAPWSPGKWGRDGSRGEAWVKAQRPTARGLRAAAGACTTIITFPIGQLWIVPEPMSKPTLHSVVTANRLREGTVIYVAPGPRWTERFDEAELFAAAEAADAALAWAKGEREVCGVYLLDVGVEASGDKKLPQRERLRAAGAVRVLERLHLTAAELPRKIARPT